MVFLEKNILLELYLEIDEDNCQLLVLFGDWMVSMILVVEKLIEQLDIVKDCLIGIDVFGVEYLDISGVWLIY